VASTTNQSRRTSSGLAEKVFIAFLSCLTLGEGRAGVAQTRSDTLAGLFYGDC
jgi:hypothetical protein